MNAKNIRIDFSKYQIDEVAETIADAIIFPLYAGRVVLNVILLSIIGLLLLTQQVSNYFITGFFFFTLSFAISLPSIVLLSTIRLIDTIKEDFIRIIEICVETSKHVYEDSILLKEQRANNVPLSATFKDVFRGVSLYVIRPALKKVLRKRIKYLAAPFVFLIDQLFKFIVIRRQPYFQVLDKSDAQDEPEDGRVALDNRIKLLGGNFTSITSGVIKAPLYIVLVIYGTVNSFLVWLFSLIF